MKTFTQWLEDHSFDLPELNDTAENNSGTKFSEKASKNFGFNYPPAYKRGQYTDGDEPTPYFMSKTADALYKMTAKPRKQADTAAE